MSSNYEKQLERQNEELKNKLAAAEHDQNRFKNFYINTSDRYGVLSFEEKNTLNEINMKFYCDYELKAIFDHIKLFTKNRTPDDPFIYLTLSYHKNGFGYLRRVFYIYSIEPTMYYQIISQDRNTKFKDLDEMRDSVLNYLASKHYFEDYFG